MKFETRCLLAILSYILSPCEKIYHGLYDYNDETLNENLLNIILKSVVNGNHMVGFLKLVFSENHRVGNGRDMLWGPENTINQLAL